MKSVLAGEIGRFVVCGLGAWVADVGLYTWLHGPGGLHPLAANLISRPAGGLVSFTGNRFWTFRSRPMARSLPAHFVRYAAVWLTALLLHEIALWGWLRVFPNNHPMVAKLLADASIGALSFLAQRFWAFR